MPGCNNQTLCEASVLLDLMAFAEGHAKRDYIPSGSSSSNGGSGSGRPPTLQGILLVVG